MPRESQKIMNNWLFELRQKEKKIYSQKGQDGIIGEIFSRIGTENTPPFCVEFGFNSEKINGGSGANVANLVLTKGWNSLLLDGDHENPLINLHKEYLTAGNICSILEKYNCPPRPDYVSIDVDSTDLWLFDSLLSKYSPRLVSVEYNANFPIEHAITHPNEKSLYRDGCSTYGASLKALDLVGKKYGYSLVYVLIELDAFFIRNDLIEGLEKPSLCHFAGLAGFPMHRKVGDGSEAEFLDYEEFVASGDIEKAKAKAAPISKKFLGV